MKKSINLYCNSCLSSKEKIKKIKEAGFDEFFTGISTHNETLNHIEQIKYAQSIGLPCTMVHCQCSNLTLHEFWEKSWLGKKVFKDFLKQIRSCKDLTKNFAIHLNSYEPFVGSNLGLKRITKLLNVCNKLDINLCVENLNTADSIRYIFSNLNHPKLKICYDIGHQNFATPEFDIVKEYGEFIEVLHIHENNGLTDEHKPLKKGSPVYNRFTFSLKLLKPEIVLTNEVKHLETNFEKDLKNILKTLTSLENNSSLN